MPKKKNSSKPKPEDDEQKAKLDALLKQFDMEVERRIYEMRRKTEQAVSSIDGIFKLALFKMPSAVKNTIWEGSQQPLPPALSSVDEALRQAELTVQNKRSTRKRAGRTAPAAELVTPQQPPRPLLASTPAVTPKFDPRTVRQTAPSTIRRQRPQELLMSLRGSPVIPAEPSPPPAERGQLHSMLQATAQQLTESPPEEMDDGTIQLMARLRDELNRMTQLSAMT